MPIPVNMMFIFGIDTTNQVTEKQSGYYLEGLKAETISPQAVASVEEADVSCHEDESHAV